MSQPPLPPLAVAFAEETLRLGRGGWPDVIEHRDIAFGSESWQRFDVFVPATVPGPLDVVVFFHGGGWTNGYKEWCAFMAPAVTATGAILVAPTYRLAPQFPYPVWLEDSFAALAAIRATVPAYGGDPDRLFLAGHSAGGTIAALLALRSDLWSGYGLPEGAIRACAPVSGILDLHHASPVPGSLEARVYEAVLAEPAQDRAASPINWLAGSDVPVFLTWGERDTERVRLSNERAVAILEQRERPFHARCYAELDHFQTQLALSDPAHDWYHVLRHLR